MVSALWIKLFFPKSRGVSCVDDHKVLSGIIYVLRNGLRSRGCRSRLWTLQNPPQPFPLLVGEGNLPVDLYVKAHRTASSLACCLKGLYVHSQGYPASPTIKPSPSSAQGFHPLNHEVKVGGYHVGVFGGEQGQGGNDGGVVVGLQGGVESRQGRMVAGCDQGFGFQGRFFPIGVAHIHACGASPRIASATGPKYERLVEKNRGRRPSSPGKSSDRAAPFMT